MADEYIIHKGRGVVRVRVGRRDGPGASADVAEDGPGEEEQGPTPGDLGDEDYLPPPRRPWLRVYDLGTRLVPGPPHSYREVDLHLALSYDWAAVEAADPFHFVNPDVDIPEESWAEYQAALLDGDPFGSVGVDGRQTPHVLQLNHVGPLGEAVMEFWPADEGLVFGGPHRTYDLDETTDWLWAAEEVGAEGWSAEVTANGLAPNTGRYRQRRRRPYTNFLLWDARYWSWLFASGSVRLTEAPDFAAPASAPTLKFPLRVFAAPALWYPYESVNCRAIVGGLWSALDGSLGSGTCTIQEYYVSHTARTPQIPTPAGPDFPAEDWLALFPEDKRAGLTIRRTAKVGAGAGQDTPDLITWEVFPGRRPLGPAAIRAEAVAQATALTAGPYHPDGPTIEEFAQPLGMVARGVTAGRLVGAVEVRGKVYYAWRAI